jgi:hypothetical protein
MKKIYKKVFEKAEDERGTERKRNVKELIDFLNNNTELKFPKNSIAIFTIIRQSYNYYMEQKKFKEAEKIANTYRPEGYVWKVINRYK